MILTTHSMEEAEVLCDTVSWLKSGNFICLGVYSSTTYVFLLSNTGSLLKSTSRSGIYLNIEKNIVLPHIIIN